MKKSSLVSLVVLSSFIISIKSAFAYPEPDRIGICYLYKANKLQSKESCLISVGNAAGQRYATLKVKGKKYFIINKPGAYGKYPYLINNKSATDYYRDSATQEKISDLSNIRDYPILCYKNQSVDICYNQVN